MKLYVDKRLTSPYALSVFVALKEKEIPFSIDYVELETGAHNNPEFAALSRTKRVPLLVVGDFSLSESTAIVEYLEDIFPVPAVYPVDKIEKATARQIQAWLRSDLMPIREERSTESFYYPFDVNELSAPAKMAVNKLIFAAKSLIKAGQENIFEEWCIADVDLALMLNRLLHNGYELPQHLAEYTRRQWMRPSVQEWVALPRPKR